MNHKFEGLSGVRCGYKAEPGEMVHIVLGWDSVTCPDCLKVRQAWEPDSVEVNTIGD